MKFKNLKAMLLVGTMAVVLALTGCGSSSLSKESVSQEEITKETDPEEEEGEILNENSGEMTENFGSSEETDKEEEVEKLSGSDFGWIQDIYTYLMDENLEAAYAVIENDSYHTDIAEYTAEISTNTDDVESIYHYVVVAMDDGNSLILCSCSNEYYNQADAAIVSTEIVEEIGVENDDDVYTLIYEYYTSYIEATTTSSGSLSRNAYIGSMWYYNFGLEDGFAMDLSEYE